MDSDNKNQNFSIGCVMCASNFTCKDDEIVVTTCGHLYHRKCLIKWLQSNQELNPRSRGSCPDCRTAIDGACDVKPVYLHYTSPDAVDIMEMKKVKQEKQELARTLFKSQAEMKKLKMQLSMEKRINGRLMVKNEVIEKKLASEINKSCSRCESELTKGRKIMSSRQRNMVQKTTVEAASSSANKVTKQLRSREYTYML